MATSTIGGKLEFLIGNAYTDTVTSTVHLDFLGQAISTVMDLLPQTTKLKYCTKEVLSTADGVNFTFTHADNRTLDCKIIAVIYDDKYNCTPVDYTEGKRMSDSNSIYAQMSGTITPVYYIMPSQTTSDAGSPATLHVLPLPSDTTTAAVYYQEYPLFQNDSKDLALTDIYAGYDSSAETYSLGNHIPLRATQAVVLKLAEYTMEHMIAQAATDEEDPELLQLYQAKLQSLKAMYAEEVMALTGGTPQIQAEG